MSKNKKSLNLSDYKKGGLADPSVAKLSISHLNDYNSHIMGKILTIIDASISDKEQCSAIKSLIKSQFWDNFDVALKWYYHPERFTQSEFPFGMKSVDSSTI